MKKIMIFALLTAVSSNVYAWGNACKFERDVDMVVELDGADEVHVKAGAGRLEIEGSDRSDIEIKAKLCSDDADALAELDVTAKIVEGEMMIVTEFPNSKKGWFGGSNTRMSIDLMVALPSTVPLTVVDSSGEATIKNVASLSIKDSSGGLEIDQVSGDISVFDSSGDLRISNIGGNAIVTDSSGGLSATNVGGDFTVDADSSGDIDIKSVKRNVLIKRDSSGSIRVKNVGGDFVVNADGSGSIDHKNVGGNISLPSK